MARMARAACAALAALCVALPALGPARAVAQEALPDAPGSAPVIDRDRSDRLLPQIPRPAPLPAAPASPAPAPVIQPAGDILLTRIFYDGASLPAAALDKAVADFIGQPLTQDRVQAIANRIVAVYARSDIAFYSVSIPAQMPHGGILVVKVVEGRLVDYSLQRETRSVPRRLVDAQMRRLMREAPLTKSGLQRSLALLRDIPGQTVDVGVRQLGPAGDLALDVTVRRKQLQIGLTIDNSGISNVVRGVQAQVAVAYNGLLREGDRLRVSGYLPLYPDRYQYYSAGYSTPIGSNGLTLGASYARMKTRSEAQVEGEAGLAGVTLSYPVIRSYKRNLKLSLSADGVNSSNYFLDTSFGRYHSRAVRLGAEYSSIGERDGFAVSLVGSQGLDVLDAQAFTGFSEKGFTKVNMQAAGVVPLTRHLSVSTTLRAQYSKDKLPVTERFALGGRGGGLAFRVGTATAEKAVAASVEIGWQLPAKSPLLKNCSLFVYADGSSGRSVARPAYALPASTVSMASVGGGARLALSRSLRASAEVAIPVSRPDASYGDKARFLFGISRAI